MKRLIIVILLLCIFTLGCGSNNYVADTAHTKFMSVDNVEIKHSLSSDSILYTYNKSGVAIAGVAYVEGSTVEVATLRPDGKVQVQIQYDEIGNIVVVQVLRLDSSPQVQVLFLDNEVVAIASLDSVGDNEAIVNYTNGKVDGVFNLNALSDF